jgi:hypothetical protein
MKDHQEDYITAREERKRQRKPSTKIRPLDLCNYNRKEKKERRSHKCINKLEWKHAVTKLKEDKQGIKEAKYRLEQIERKKKESTTTCHLQ